MAETTLEMTHEETLPKRIAEFRSARSIFVEKVQNPKYLSDMYEIDNVVQGKNVQDDRKLTDGNIRQLTAALPRGITVYVGETVKRKTLSEDNNNDSLYVIKNGGKELFWKSCIEDSNEEVMGWIWIAPKPYVATSEKPPTINIKITFLLCEMCICQNAAIYYCETCKKDICETCKQLHNIILKMMGHDILMK